MQANDVKAFESNVVIRDAIARGEIETGLINHYYVLEAIAEEGDDYPVKLHFFGDGDIGSLVNVAGAAVLESSEHKAEARRFVDFLLGDEAQRYFAEDDEGVPAGRGRRARPGAAGARVDRAARPRPVRPRRPAGHARAAAGDGGAVATAVDTSVPAAVAGPARGAAPRRAARGGGARGAGRRRRRSPTCSSSSATSRRPPGDALWRERTLALLARSVGAGRLRRRRRRRAGRAAGLAHHPLRPARPARCGACSPRCRSSSPATSRAYLFVSALGPRGELQQALAPLGVDTPAQRLRLRRRLARADHRPPTRSSCCRCARPSPGSTRSSRMLRAGWAARAGARSPRSSLRSSCRPSGAGALLVALYALSDFGAVSILRFDSFTRVIYQSYRASFDRTGAAALAALLVLVMLALLAVEARARRRRSYHRTTPGTARRPVVTRLGRWRWPALALCATVVGLAVVLPVGDARLLVGAQRGRLGRLGGRVAGDRQLAAARGAGRGGHDGRRGARRAGSALATRAGRRQPSRRSARRGTRCPASSSPWRSCSSASAPSRSSTSR